MADELVFYTNPQSRGLTTHWMLEEIGCPYRMEVKAYGPEMKAPDYLAINPMGKVPAIKHGDTVVTETGAILCYLADAYPAAKLAPPAGDRGAYYRWLFFGAGCFEPALLDKMMKRPEVERKSAVGWGSYDDVIGTLKKALATGPYLLGEKFTAADVYIGSELGFAIMFGAPGLKGEPAIDAYLARLTARPAFQRATAG